ncbi:lipoprotein, putative [Staphylococcus aureus subsp. aureus 6850]|uniref:hypothetical protein n=1 Tax=Staphylococcus aureus TaxID=1280 RepID=UPI00038F29D7|nr:hypothetical protein [Staphylococcus aureus]AGU55962.1 lipoprotein, putative [Staphylococcus aureus subsp. aureus 6850]
MKRLVTGLLALSLFLAACGQDSDQQKDSNKEKDDKAKTEQQDKKTNDSSKDKKDNKDDSKDVNKDNKDNSANDNQQQSNSNATNNDQNQTNNNQSSNNQANNNQANNNQKSSYVAPYYGQNAAPVARQIYPFNGNKTQALQQLPNFQTALNAANNEANKFGSNNKVYNDYSIEEHNGNYKYVFSFKDPNANGKYSIVTVDYTGQAMVTDPNYQQ